MKRKLKTWEQFEKEFEPIADEWHINDLYDVVIDYNNMHWYINRTDMIKRFGTEIEVKKINDKDYTYMSNSYYYWHELWFEPEYKEIEFISKEEVEI